MDLSHARIALRPRSWAENHDLAFRYLSDARGVMLPLSIAVLVPPSVLCYLLFSLGEWSAISTWCVALALQTAVQGVFTVACGMYMFDAQPSAWASLRTFIKRAPRYAMVLLLSRLWIAISMLGFFTVALPVWIWMRQIHVHEVCLLELQPPLACLKRSAKMSQMAWLEVLSLIFAIVAAWAAFPVIAEALLAIGILDNVLSMGRPFGDLLTVGVTPFALLGFFLATPYLAVLRFLFYIDQRTRTDGWDLQVELLRCAAQRGER